MGEQWKHAWGFSRYMVSDMGRVKSRETGLFLIQTVSPDGHKVVEVTTNNGVKMLKKVSRLVVDTFDWSPDGYRQVVHRDGDKFNNRRSNLEQIDEFVPKKRKRAVKSSEATETQTLLSARGIRRFARVIHNETGDVYESQAAVARRFGVDAADLGRMLRGVSRQKSLKGHTFRFEEESIRLSGQSMSVRVRETGETFPSIAAAATRLGVDRSGISKHLRGTQGYDSVKGYSFEYVERGAVHHNSGKATPGRNQPRPLRCIETGKIYPSQMACARDMNLWQSGIGGVLRGEKKSYYNFTFEYVEDENA